MTVVAMEEKKMEFHKIAEIFPLLEGVELRDLANDVSEHGLHHPILLYEGEVLDGRNRLEACNMAGVEPVFEEFDGTPQEAIEHVWSLNVERRHLTASQRALCNALRDKLLNSYAGVREEAKKRKRATSAEAPRNEKGQLQPVRPQMAAPVNEQPVTTRDARAEEAGVAHSYISLADRLVEEEPELAEQVKQGRISIPKAAAELREKGKKNETPNGKKVKIIKYRHQGLVVGIAEVEGFCDILAMQTVDTIPAICPPEERELWATKATQCAKVLREFARKMKESLK